MNEITPNSENDAPVDSQTEYTSTEEKLTTNKTRKIGIISIVVFSAIALPILLIIITFSGGVGSIISNQKRPPDTTSSDFIDKKNLAKLRIGESFDSLERLATLEPYGTSSVDGCQQGQNNWKVREGYAHRCIYRTSKFYGISDDLRKPLLGFEQNIIKNGWNDSDSPECEHCTISDVIHNYYDDPEQNTNALYLPPEPASYTKQDLSLDIMFAHKTLASDDFFGYYSLGPDNHTQQDFRDGLTAVLKEHKYVLVVSIQQIFFEN